MEILPMPLEQRLALRNRRRLSRRDATGKPIAIPKTSNGPTSNGEAIITVSLTVPSPPPSAPASHP